MGARKRSREQPEGPSRHELLRVALHDRGGVMPWIPTSNLQNGWSKSALGRVVHVPVFGTGRWGADPDERRLLDRDLNKLLDPTLFAYLRRQTVEGDFRLRGQV